MSEDASDVVSDKHRLMFGAGFIFGVMFTMLILAVVTVTVASGQEGLLASEVIVTIVAGIIFAVIVGVSLYLLAFEENRVELPVEDLLGLDSDEVTTAEDPESPPEEQ